MSHINALLISITNFLRVPLTGGNQSNIVYVPVTCGNQTIKQTDIVLEQGHPASMHQVVPQQQPHLKEENISQYERPPNTPDNTTNEPDRTQFSATNA